MNRLVLKLIRSASVCGFCAVLFCLPAYADAPPQGPPLLRVGTTGDYAPFTSSDGNQYTGLDSDIAAALARDLGFELRWERFAWPTLTARVASGDFDLVLSGVTMRPERALVGRYTRPYAITGAVALVRTADAARFPSIAAINQPTVRLIVNRGGHLERVARQHFPLASISAVDDNRSVPQAVVDQSADVALTDSAEMREWLRPGLHVVGPFTHDYKAVLLPADRGDLAARVNAWLAEHESNGWLPQRREQWLGNGAPTPAAQAQREAVAALIQLRLSLMPGVGAAKRAVNLPIVDPEQEARVLSRVAEAAKPDPKPMVDLYRELIELAKAVQEATPTAGAPADLNVLRAAIARIDEQLAQEMRRNPVGTVAEWQAVINQAVDLPGIDVAARHRLAAVLAR